jgi:hypothetical protein
MTFMVGICHLPQLQSGLNNPLNFDPQLLILLG